MTIRTVIADDEPLALAALRVNLAAKLDVEVIAEASGGQEAIEAVTTLVPDLLFLDIQMPDANGVQVVEALASRHLPAIVFVTAFDRYAVKAFDIHAVDYLLKPFTRERFQDALSAARRYLAGVERLKSVEHDAPQHSRVHGPVNRIAVKQEGRTVLIDVNEVDWIQSAGNYCVLHLNAKSYIVHTTMVQILSRLDSNRFVRIHRAAIVNVARISELVPQGHCDYDVVLTTGQLLRLSRHYRASVLSSLSKKKM